MDTHDCPANKDEGSRRILTAGFTVLLLSLTAIMGLSLSPTARATIAQEVVGSGPPLGVAVQDSSGPIAWVRSASLAKPTRSQSFLLGGSSPDDNQRIVGLLPFAGFGHRGVAVVRQGDRHGNHWAASGQFTRRKPTGPPSTMSLAI